MPSASTSRRQALAALLLCLVVLLWGINWPVIKQVVALMPPLSVSETPVGRGALALGVAGSRIGRGLLSVIRR